MSSALDLRMTDYRLEFGVFALMLLLLLPGLGEWLEFSRQALDQGQIWRLFTAHFVHMSLTHALGNAAGLAFLGFIIRHDLSEKLLIWLFAWCALLVSGGLYWFAPDLQRYVGLSGVLHGMLLVVPFLMPLYRGWPAWLLLIAIAGKVLWEQTPLYNDQALMDVIGGRVETRAHLFGVIAGGIWLVAMALLRKLSRN